MASDMKLCGVCDSEFGVHWTDTHGVAACVRCGAPYRIYHYEGKARVEKPPEIQLQAWYIPFARRYWQEVQRYAPPGFNFPGSSYEHASRADFDAYNRWHDEHRAELEDAQPAEPAHD